MKKKINSINRINVCDRKSALKYLERVSKDWYEFCRSHRQFQRAINILINDLGGLDNEKEKCE